MNQGPGPGKGARAGAGASKAGQAGGKKPSGPKQGQKPSPKGGAKPEQAAGKQRPAAQVITVISHRTGIQRLKVRRVLEALATLTREAMKKKQPGFVVPGIARLVVGGPKKQATLRPMAGLRRA